MRRISTDADYLRDGTVRIDADGIPVDLTAPLRVDTSVGVRITADDVMVYGSTGLRNISDQLPDGAAGTLTFQRQNGVCELVFANVTIPEGVDSFPVALPGTSPTAQGFKPVSANTFGTTAPQFHQVMLYAGSVHRVFMTLANLRSLRGSVQWLTTDPWPTALPGTPA